MAKQIRGLIVGASTLLGKELLEELSTSSTSWDLRLADADETDGRLAQGANEPLLIQPLTPAAFEGVDVAFFAQSGEVTRAHWHEAKAAGAAIVDLTGALENEDGALVYSPWMAKGSPRLMTSAVIPAHPAAVMLGVVAARLEAAFSSVQLAATVLEPASQQGSAGMDELHQQTVGLIGFRSLPQDVYNAQVAFTLRVSLGAVAKLSMKDIGARIRTHLRHIAGARVASRVAMQLVQAPVFHAYTMSVYVELPPGTDEPAVRAALRGDWVELTDPGAEPPDNQSATQQNVITLSLTSEGAKAEDVSRYWLWMAADNLKLWAKQASLCGEQFALARPGVSES